MKRIVVVPTYNERENVLALLPQLRKLDCDVLVVDDRGADDTAAAVASLAERDGGIHLLARDARQGYASALRAGWDWALAHGYEQVAQMDADGNHDAVALPALFAALDEADLAIGSRYVAGGSTPRWSSARRGLSRLAGWYVRRTLHLPLTDPTGGYRAWRAELLRAVASASTRADGFAILVESAWEALRAGARVREVPITFHPRVTGRSKASAEVARDWWRVVRLLRRETRE